MSPADETSVTTSDAGTVRGGPLAHKINYLFETVRRPDGKSYSNEEVAEAITERGEATISGTYLWYLRRGDRDNPTKKHLEVLARFFSVSPAYFFDDAPGLPRPRSTRARTAHPPAAPTRPDAGRTDPGRTEGGRTDPSQSRPPEIGFPQADWLAEASPGTTHPGTGHPPGASPGHHPADYSAGPHTIGQPPAPAHGSGGPPGTHPGPTHPVPHGGTPYPGAHPGQAHAALTHSGPTHAGPSHAGAVHTGPGPSGLGRPVQPPSGSGHPGSYEGSPHPASAHPGSPYPGSPHPSAAHGTVWPDDDGSWVAVLLHGLSPRSLRAVADVIGRIRELEGLPPAHPGLAVRRPDPHPEH